LRLKTGDIFVIAQLLNILRGWNCVSILGRFIIWRRKMNDIRPFNMPEEVRAIFVEWANNIFAILNKANSGSLENYPEFAKHHDLNIREISLYVDLIYRVQIGDKCNSRWALLKIEKKLKRNKIPRKIMLHLKKQLNYINWRKNAVAEDGNWL
jgi:hypothetical protein